MHQRLAFPTWMGESSMLPKSWILQIQILKLIFCQPNINHFKFERSSILRDTKIQQDKLNSIFFIYAFHIDFWR